MLYLKKNQLHKLTESINKALIGFNTCELISPTKQGLKKNHIEHTSNVKLVD